MTFGPFGIILFFMEYKEYLETHNKLWKEAQDFDVKFIKTIISKSNDKFSFNLSVQGNGVYGNVMSHFGFEAQKESLENLPLPVLEEFIVYKRSLVDWNQGKIKDFPF